MEFIVFTQRAGGKKIAIAAADVRKIEEMEEEGNEFTLITIGAQDNMLRLVTYVAKEKFDDIIKQIYN